MDKEELIDTLEKVLNKRKDYKSNSSWALIAAITHVKRGITPSLILESMLDSLCDSHDKAIIENPNKEVT